MTRINETEGARMSLEAALIDAEQYRPNESLVEFEGYFRSEQFVANALGLRTELKKLSE